ncbi:class II glutamine amidotransferase [Acidisphaera sp. L21]|uniref:class II glutamine amidotransferase n=1 Tax=Acidisphaera sp. L21 TaxID=1641851 RepID=UPI00131EC719|nr:class II glutamine amidotransferase [Acidisphaera sp. L21]
MCRFLAYQGEPILIESLVCAPCHSLVHQSLHASEGKTETNGDGFGMGWYGERPEPGLYREVRPAWSDENLRSLASQVRSGLFFAHVRASTGTATTRANCHPFSAGGMMFMHNGQVGEWAKVRRRVEAMIPDDFYDDRTGTTDSEAIFLAALARGLAADPVAAIAATLADIRTKMGAAGIAAPLRFTAALTDGARLWAFRWASDNRPATLYWRQDARGLVVVSEPIDDAAGGWTSVPAGHVLVSDRTRAVQLQPLAELALAA